MEAMPSIRALTMICTMGGEMISCSTYEFQLLKNNC